jgi:membrane-bound lytic murein transglycosylase
MAEIHKRSKKQEDRIAGAYKGSRNVMSGAGWAKKADVRTHKFLIEAKTTENKSYSLKLSELREIRRQALMDDRIPLFLVEIQGHNYVVMEDDDFQEMMDDDDR